MAAVGVKRECYSLSGVESQTEEPPGILRSCSSEVGGIVAPRRRDLRQCVRHPRRLVALAPKRNRSQVGRVRLDQNAIEGNEAQQVVIRPLLERHHAGERDVPAGGEGVLGQRLRSGKTVKNADHAGSTSVADDGAGVVLGVAGVNDHWLARLRGEGDLRGECPPLCRAR
jgi:hypothetical protein